MFLEVGKVKFKDSLNWLPMPLAALPRAFDIQECKKGKNFEISVCVMCRKNVIHKCKPVFRLFSAHV